MALITEDIRCPSMRPTVGCSSQPLGATSTTCASLIVTQDGGRTTRAATAESTLSRCALHMHLPLGFLNDVLKAAQVSGTVLVTALTYIYRMKARYHQWEDSHSDCTASQTQGYD